MDMRPLALAPLLLVAACSPTKTALDGAGAVLHARGFAPPLRCQRDGRECAVAVRPLSAASFDLVVVEGGPPPRVAILAYHRGPSDWALLGTLIRDTSSECRAIEAALGAPRPAR